VNYLELFNGLAQRVKPATYKEIPTLNARLRDHGLDSLDVVLLCVYTCEVFGIPEEIGKAMNPATCEDIRQFAERHGTHTPASVAEALARVDG
jgi:acyl carrier protein